MSRYDEAIRETAKSCRHMPPLAAKVATVHNLSKWIYGMTMTELAAEYDRVIGVPPEERQTQTPPPDPE